MQSRFFYILDDPLLVFHKLFLIWYLRNVNMVLEFSAIIEYFQLIFFYIENCIVILCFQVGYTEQSRIFSLNSPFARMKMTTKPSYLLLSEMVGEFVAQKNSKKTPSSQNDRRYRNLGYQVSYKCCYTVLQSSLMINQVQKNHTYQGCHER